MAASPILGQCENASGYDWDKRTGGRYDNHEQGLGRTYMSATEKTDIQEAEAIGPRLHPNKPAPLARIMQRRLADMAQTADLA
jgi:hypothetical protein